MAGLEGGGAHLDNDGSPGDTHMVGLEGGREGTHLVHDCSPGDTHGWTGGRGCTPCR